MKRIHIQQIFCSIPPSSEEILKYDLLDLHEGAFWLTGWPINLYKCSCNETMREKNISRSFFYLPGPHPEHQTPYMLEFKPEDLISKQPDFLEIAQKASEPWLFNPTDMGYEFLELYSAMQDAARSGLLETKTETLFIGDIYKENTSTLVSPQNLIKWALENGFCPLEEVQNCTVRVKGYDKKLRDRRKVTQDHVEDGIVYQFLKIYFPEMKEQDYYKHDWMKRYGTAEKSIDKTSGKIRKSTAKFRPEQKPGAPPRKSKKIYRPKVISDVITEDSCGSRRYNIDLLRVAMETAANVIFEHQQKFTTLHQFMENFMKNEIVLLYTKNAPPLILEFILEYAENVVSDYFFCLSCINAVNR